MITMRKSEEMFLSWTSSMITWEASARFLKKTNLIIAIHRSHKDVHRSCFLHSTEGIMNGNHSNYKYPIYRKNDT